MRALLYGEDRSPGRALGRHQVLEGHTQEVPFVRGKVLGLALDDAILEEPEHVLESVALLGHSCHKG